MLAPCTSSTNNSVERFQIPKTVGKKSSQNLSMHLGSYINIEEGTVNPIRYESQDRDRDESPEINSFKMQLLSQERSNPILQNSYAED